MGVSHLSVVNDALPAVVVGKSRDAQFQPRAAVGEGGQSVNRKLDLTRVRGMKPRRTHAKSGVEETNGQVVETARDREQNAHLAEGLGDAAAARREVLVSLVDGDVLL